MRKSIYKTLMVLITVTTLTVSTATSAWAATINLDDDSLYSIKNYVSGDCLLSSNAYMIKRMAMLMGSDSYASITNDALRKTATVDGVNTVKSNFTYTKGGIEYTVSRGSLSGTVAQKCEFLRTMLLEHPEGIVVWGGEPDTSYAGPHGVLVTNYNPEKSYLYVADSANNYNGNNEGITSWAGSIMFSIKYCSAYFYISSVRLTSKAKIDSIENAGKGEIKVNWKSIKGPNRYQISKTKSSDKTYIAKTIQGNTATSAVLAPATGTTYYYKIRGVNKFTYTDWMGSKHTNVVYGDWSAAKDWKL